MKSYYDHTMGKPALSRTLVHHIHTMDFRTLPKERPCYFCRVFFPLMGAGLAWMVLRFIGVM